MRIGTILFTVLFIKVLFITSFAQQLPYVYEVENTGADCPIPYLPSFNELPVINSLPDPFEWSDGRGRIKNISDWRLRRAEIKAEIEHYEIGIKPDRPENITASYSNGLLTVNITIDDRTLTLTSQVILPEGEGPFPVVIGMNSPSGSIPASIFTSRNIARITYNHNQVTTYYGHSNTNPYYRLYPELNVDNTGQYSAWAWGVSRLIDGLELVQDVLPINLKRIAVTGCSYAGKMALFAGALDERIALTIAQESGGGGYTTWRFSEEINKRESVETLGKTDYSWFRNSMSQFSNAVSKLPHDHHELMAMVAPRALFVTGNPGWVWLADESGHVGSKATKEVYKALGIPDRFGYSLVGGHGHCAVPNSQIPEIEAFVEKFLLGNENVDTNVETTPYTTDLSKWITWDTPILGNDTTYFTTLIYPANNAVGLDTNITFRWKKIDAAEKYYIQVSNNNRFTNIVKSDSIVSDTLVTINNLEKNSKYYWRIQVKSSGNLGPWSNINNFITTLSQPSKPQLLPATQFQTGNVKLNWKKVEGADLYSIQISKSETFNSIFKSATSTDTFTTISWFTEGQKHFWRLRAENLAGNSEWSEVSDFTLIDAPTDLTLSINDANEIVIKWSDKSFIEDGYIIERLHNSQNYFTIIDSLEENSSEYIDKNIELSKTYTYRVKAYNGNSESNYSNEATISLVSIKENEELPTEYSLSQNYPNPFNPTTKIKFALPQTAKTKISIYDLLGKELETLLNNELQPGYYEINFNADIYPSGIYFYRIQSGNFIQTKKMILMK